MHVTFRTLGALAVAALAAVSYAQDTGRGRWPGAPAGVVGPLDTRAAGVAPVAGQRPVARGRVELGEQEGEPWGSGPGYEIVFHDGWIDFQPAIGRTLERSHSLRFRAESIARRDGPPQRIGTATRRTDDLSVSYVRPEVVERYELRRDGVEQSFVFDRLPPGSGDLVVRGRVDTEFPIHRIAPDGVEFALDDRAGVSIGAVTGIDARGRTARGTMAYEDGVLELVLPAGFVDTAALPLVLDPPIGSMLNLSASTWDERDPDTSFDTTTNRYIVCWEREVSGNWYIRARLFSNTGAPVSGVLAVRSSSTPSFDPRVANINMRDSFVICWDEGRDIKARAVRARDGALSNTINVVSSVEREVTPDIGGEATVADDDAIVVWHDLGLGRIRARQVSLNASFVLSPTIPLVDITTTSRAVGRPAISKSGGPTGRYLIVWHQAFSPTDTDIYGALYTRNLGAIDPGIVIDAAVSDENDPECDGDGTSWCVVYETERTAGSRSNDIVCRTLLLDGTTVVRTASRVIVASGPSDEENASVAWCGGSCLVGFAVRRSAPATNYGVTVGLIDPFSCQICEPFFSYQSGATIDCDNVQFATQYHGSADSGRTDALVVWEAFAPGSGEISGWRYRAEDGKVADLGGRCGAGGTAFATCVRVGFSPFAHRVRGAASGVTAFLVMSLDRIDFACGPCTLVPDPFTGFVFAATTDSHGSAEVLMPIPAASVLEGLVFYDQWLVASRVGCPILGSYDLSNAIRVEIQ